MVARQMIGTDFKRRKDGIPAKVLTIEYDPNRTANIALICYADGVKSYILAPNGLTVGQTVMNGENAEVRVGNCLPLQNIPIGSEIHNIELYPGKGGGQLSLINGHQQMVLFLMNVPYRFNLLILTSTMPYHLEFVATRTYRGHGKDEKKAAKR